MALQICLLPEVTWPRALKYNKMKVCVAEGCACIE